MSLGKSKLIVASLLFLLSLLLRLNGISQSEPQVDEPLWVKRSHGVVERLSTEDNRFRATTHLGHPGIVPALLMAAGQEIFPRVFSSSDALSRFFSHELYSSRVTCALVTSLIAPVIFLGFAHLLGGPIAASAGLLSTLDPRLLAYSRIAHLDGTLTLLCLLCFCLFVYSELKSSFRLKLTAGIVWGMCIATKPTAVLLLPVFLFFKWLRNIKCGKAWRIPISASDFWAIFVGHLFFAAIYTRLWLHNSDYRERLKIRVPLAGDIYRLGGFFQEHLLLTISLLLVGIGLIVFIYRRLGPEQRSSESFFSIACLLQLSFLMLIIFPQVIENFIRFWAWTFGLSGEVHHSYNVVVQPPTGGYWLELATVLPELTLAGLLFTGYIGIKSVKSRLSLQGIVLLSLAFWILIWLGFLGISAKQSWRYAIPVVPAVLILSAFGWVGFATWFSNILKAWRYSRGLLLITVLSLLTLFVGPVFAWHPNYSAYFNSISGGLPAALNRRQAIGFLGEVEAFKFLKQKCSQRRLLNVAVFGSSTNFQIISGLQAEGQDRGCMIFGYFRPDQADFAIRFLSHPDLVPKGEWQELFSQKPVVFNYRLKGVNLLEMIALRN